MSQSVVFQYLSAGSFNVTVPSGFSNQVLVYAWGAGGGTGTGAPGGGGGYAAGVVTIDAGDSVVISVGGTGGSIVGRTSSGSAGGTGNNPIVDLSGGVGAPGGDPEDNDAGGAGGGGGASAIFVNNIPMIVAAGGGGGGGLGEDWASSGYENGLGRPGGVATQVTTTPRGADGRKGGAGGAGGGGGGYPFGGDSQRNLYGDDVYLIGQGGFGGQNYANATVTSSSLLPGSGTNTAGTTNGFYPGKSRGKATFDGCVILVFQKLFTAWIKQAGDWKQVTNAYIKTGNTVITSSTPAISTINYSAWIGSASALNSYIDSILAGGTVSASDTAWYTMNPPLTQSPFVSTIFYNKSMFVSLAGVTKITGTAGQTTFTSGLTTYTRGSLAFTTTISRTLPGVGTITSTVSVYNYSISTTSSTPTVLKTIAGGWKQIVRGWMKKDGVWKDISTPLTLESSRVATTPSTRARINIVIASNTTSYNLLDTLNSLGTYYPGYSDITLTVNAGVVVDSDSAGGAALTVDGLTSGDSLIIVNNGTIRGRGGAGGAPGWLKTTVVSSGKNTTTSTSVQPAYPGGAGGTGLAITYIATLENNGNIYAGGGGGGGGGISYNGTGGGQGGGGAGFGPGANAGTATTGGAGANNGGAGGSNGANGTTGTTGATITVVNANGKGSTSVPGSAGGAGGIGGKAIAGYAKLTVTVEGTIVGPRA